MPLSKHRRYNQYDNLALKFELSTGRKYTSIHQSTREHITKPTRNAPTDQHNNKPHHTQSSNIASNAGQKQSNTAPTHASFAISNG